MHYFFFWGGGGGGEATLSLHTASTIDTSWMKHIKAIVISKFGAKRSDAHREMIWVKCKTATWQKCKMFHVAKMLRGKPSD